MRDHYEDIYRVCHRICNSVADAEDATQEACIKFAKSINSFGFNSSLKTWIYRIATNAALDLLRAKKRHPISSIDELSYETASTAVANNEDEITTRDEVVSALSMLSEEFRVAVVLRDVADLDYSEISEVLKVPIGTVRSRISRGRAAFAEALARNPEAGVDRLTDVENENG